MSILTPRTIVITTSNSTLQNGSEISVNMDAMMATDSDDTTDMGEPRKRRRLNHLSPDEKFLRRKLKNRVAAQTARDRKKVQMSDMEIRIAKLEDANQKLVKENVALKVHSDCLVTENNDLKERLGQCNHGDSTDLANSDKSETKSPGSAAFAVPLPQEQISTPVRWMERYQACTVILSILLSLACFKAENKPTSSASRKRKQSRPSRLVRIIKRDETVPNPLLNPAGQWWGPHQQSWNPSMN